MKIHCKYDKLVSIADLKPHPKNRNKHPGEQIERLAEILRYQGWRYPVKVSKLSGFVTSGHGRIEAATLNKWEKVPVNYQDYEDEDQEYADVTADNAIASWAELDLSGINADVGDLGPDFNLDLLGIKDFVLDMSEKQGDPDAVPEVPRVAKTKRGELWILGEHRILIDDCTVKENVERLMAGERAALCFTSPPYSDQRDYTGGNLEPAHLAKCMAAPVDIFAVNLGYQRRDGAVFRYWDEWIRFAESIGLKLLSWNIWDRTNAASIGQQTAMFPIEHEWIFVFGSEQIEINRTIENKYAGELIAGSSNRQADGSMQKSRIRVAHSHRPIGTILRCDIHRGESPHPAMFPVEFPEKYIEACTHHGSVVFEPFSGSGSTLIACEKTQRRCFGMEIEPLYGDVILERFATFSGKDPVREDGVKWSELSGEVK